MRSFLEVFPNARLDRAARGTSSDAEAAFEIVNYCSEAPLIAA
jgi:hypothetical protein